MIRRMILASTVALSFALIAPLTAQAQNIFVLGGAVFPTGFDEAEFFNTGWLGAAGVSFDVGENGMFAGVEGTYAQSSVDDSDLPSGVELKAKAWSAMAFLGYSVPTEGSIDPYFFAGGGLQGVKLSLSGSAGSADDSESAFGYQFGAGVSIGDETSSVRPLVEVRYQGSGDEDVDLKFVGVLVGASFSVGN